MAEEKATILFQYFPENRVRLADKVGGDACFLLGQGDARLAPSLHTFEEIGHIPAKEAHDLHTFQILCHLLRRISMDHIPIPGGNDGHLGDGKILVELIQCGGGSCTPCGHDGRCRFQPEGINASTGGGIEGPIQNGFFVAMSLVIAIALVDAFYILLASLGASKLLGNEKVEKVVKIVGAIVLMIFGLNIILNVFGINIIPSFISSHSAMNHAHGQSLLAAGMAPTEAPIQVKGHPGQVAHVLQQGKKGEEDGHGR